MAEFVELQMERSMIEFEQMKTLKLFDEQELKEIVKRREAFEYLLVKQQKILKDYLEYIKYERNLMSLVKERQRERNSELKLELSIEKKIKKLYGMATARFPDVERLWEEYILFCHRSRSDQTEVRVILTRMRQFHGDKPDCWIKAIKWEREHSTDVNKSIDVRALLLQGMQRHPTSVHLCVELINIILTSSIAVELKMQQALLAYASCSKKVSSLAFHLAMLEEATRHGFAGKLEEQILDDMKKLHFKEPLFWHTIAQRELKGLATYHASVDSNPTMRSRIELCVQVYQGAVGELDNAEMWSYYLDAMLMMNRDTSSQLPLRRRMLGQAYKKSDTQGRMNILHYSEYVSILYDSNASNDLVEEILKRAIGQFGDSVEVWTMYLQHFMRNNDPDRAKVVFEQSRKRLATAACPLWVLYVNYLKTLPNAGTLVKELYEEVIMQVSPEFDAMKISYIDWAYTMGGRKWPLVMFKRANTLGTLTMGMVQRIHEFESLQLVSDTGEWRQLLELGIVRFGATHPEIWLMLVNFELAHGDPINVSKVTERAKNTLNCDLLDTFLSGRELQQLQMVCTN